MISRIFIACLFLGMYSTGSLLSCKWIVKHHFSLYNTKALGLLDMMITNTAKDAEIEHNVTFPNQLYHQKFNATDEDKLAFIVQILKELFDLFEKDRSSAPWEENTVENFLNIVNKMAEELQCCPSIFFRLSGAESLGSSLSREGQTSLYPANSP
ncbi:interferon a3-like [Pelmatolapia mariae]|uniref:interferon a3-like n=1 Tax=Pelmatolapia mariae TaxID=158779 RepID=UPI002FE5A850